MDRSKTGNIKTLRYIDLIEFKGNIMMASAKKSFDFTKNENHVYQRNGLQMEKTGNIICGHRLNGNFSEIKVYELFL